MKLRLRGWVKFVLFIIFITGIFSLYSRYIGTNGFIVKEYPIIDSNIKENFHGLKIIHISDIHYKITTTKKELQKIVKEINLLKPDIVILSGDLFNKNIEYDSNDYNDLIEVLSDIKSNIGSYAIKGDNDSNKNWEDVIKKSNFINLNDKFEYIYYNDIEPILLVGINSNYEDNHIKETINSIYEKTNTKYNYSILVLHEPDYIQEIEYSKFNLILSGHSLNGIIKLPFIGGLIRPSGAKVYYDEYYDVGDTKLYISGGIGCDKFKFRFSNKPSFNFYRLRNK